MRWSLFVTMREYQICFSQGLQVDQFDFRIKQINLISKFSQLHFHRIYNFQIKRLNFKIPAGMLQLLDEESGLPRATDATLVHKIGTLQYITVHYSTLQYIIRSTLHWSTRCSIQPSLVGDYLQLIILYLRYNTL